MVNDIILFHILSNNLIVLSKSKSGRSKSIREMNQLIFWP